MQTSTFLHYYVPFYYLIWCRFSASLSAWLISLTCKTLVRFISLQKNYRPLSHSLWKRKRGRSECKATANIQAVEGQEGGGKEEKRWQLVQSEVEVMDASMPSCQQEWSSEIKRLQIPAQFLHPVCVLACPPLALESRRWCSLYSIFVHLRLRTIFRFKTVQYVPDKELKIAIFMLAQQTYTNRKSTSPPA